MTTKRPTFQSLSSSRRFEERTVGEKKAHNRPHFENQSRQNKPMSKTFKNEKIGSGVTEAILDNARRTGSVKVTVRAKEGKIKEKKTGPLSPRAPEKIKKNRAEEMKVYGEQTCLALFAERPESIVRVWTTVEMSHRLGDVLSYLAANKKAYHVVSAQELALVSDSEHHGGICMLVKKSRPFTLTGYLEIPRRQDCLVLLHDLKNAHNIGGVVRTCSFYGIKGIVVDDHNILNSATAMRIAEGGMEYIRPLQTDNVDEALQKLRQAGYQVIHVTNDKQAVSWQKTRLADKVVFVVGETFTGHLAKEQDVVVNLCYANPLKNGLNVAVATGVLLSAWTART